MVVQRLASTRDRSHPAEPLYTSQYDLRHTAPNSFCCFHTTASITFHIEPTRSCPATVGSWKSPNRHRMRHLYECTSSRSNKCHASLPTRIPRPLCCEMVGRKEHMPSLSPRCAATRRPGISTSTKSIPTQHFLCISLCIRSTSIIQPRHPRISRPSTQCPIN